MKQALGPQHTASRLQRSCRSAFFRVVVRNFPRALTYIDCNIETAGTGGG